MFTCMAVVIKPEKLLYGADGGYVVPESGLKPLDNPPTKPPRTYIPDELSTKFQVHVF